MGCGGSKAKAQGQQEAQAPNLLQGSAATGDAKVCPEGDYKVTLERSGDADTLGMSIVGNENNAYKIQSLKEEGMVPTYNKTQENTPEQQVKTGDLIVAVNGAFGDLEAMKTQLSEKAVTLTLKRAAAEAETAPAATEEAAPAEPAAAEPAAEPPAEAAAEPAAPPAEYDERDWNQATEATAGEPVAVEQVAAAAPEVAASTEVEAAPEAAVVTLTPSPPVDNEESLPIVEEPLELNPEGGKCTVCGC